MASMKKKPIEQYDHKGKKRANNPPVGLVTPDTDKESKKKTYAYDPHLDPQLIWAGKAEHTSFEVPTVSLHVHERIDPRTIIEAVRKRNGTNGKQLSLFQSPEENPPLREAIEFYKHKHGWSNRLVAGDSLLVMNSLFEKEGLAGQVQMIYIDPPYGIKYGSNFQPFVNKRDVKDGKDEDLTQEPEMIKAFRDTWELGIHSYLAYLRDRLLLGRDLLSDSGSIFVQISDENVHHIRELMDEIIGKGNFVAIIVLKKTSAPTDKFLPTTSDFVLWYAKDRNLVKYHQLYLEKKPGEEGTTQYVWVELSDGRERKLSKFEQLDHSLLENGSKVFAASDSTSSHEYSLGKEPFVFRGKPFTPKGRYWSTSPEGMSRIAKTNRFFVSGDSLFYKRYWIDFPCYSLSNIWTDTSSSFGERLYVVQTTVKTIGRCLLMTTDPGDLVLDPTCVRKGTRVWTVEDPSLTLPASEEEKNPTLALPASGEEKNPTLVLPASGEEKNPALVLPASGEEMGAGGDEVFPPFTGGTKGGSIPKLLPIESLRPGDSVIGHDGKPHTIQQVIKKSYRGQMIGLKHSRSSATLWMTSDHRVLTEQASAHDSVTDWSEIPKGHFGRARRLRRESSPAERKLWSVLCKKQTGVKFRRQHPIGPYIADFYSRDACLVVEVDGSTHFTPEALAYDEARNKYMHALGLAVCRFTTRDVEENLEGVHSVIEDQCTMRMKSTRRRWVCAGDLRAGDIVFFGPELVPVPITSIETATTEEEVYDLTVQDIHSFLTEVCAVHNCGSGTTAYVAEQWGRRWITCDTSRVALTLAKQRLMTGLYDYYELAHPQEGVGSGFKYKTVPHITLKSIANNPEIKEGMTREQIDRAIAKYADQETLYDQPFMDRSRARVSGPFTVEAVPAPVVKPLSEIENTQPADESVARSGETLRQAEWRDELLKCGIRGKKGQYILFSRVEPLGGTRWLHADAETKPNNRGGDSVREGDGDYGGVQRAVISFGPEHQPLEQRQVALALEEANTLVPKPKMVIFAAFQFDPEAAKDIDETRWPGVTLLKVQMNADLLTEDLKKKRASNESFWLIGQPDVRVAEIKSGKDKGKYQVEVAGFDYYNTKTGQIESGGTDKIAVWMLDTDYDGRSLFPRQVFFPMSGEKDGWSKLAKNLKAEIDEELIEAYRGNISLPFEAGVNRRIAVKIVDDRGIESLKIIEVE
jgi:very-short-patch-repair endonuclease/DNA modification methylase